MSDYRTDRARVTGLGSAKEGVGEWWASRVSSVALIPLSLLFLLIVGPLIGSDLGTVQARFANPLNAIIVILFLAVAFKHLADGLQEIIVDYVHHKGLLPIVLVGTRLLCYGFGFAGAFAVARLAFMV